MATNKRKMKTRNDELNALRNFFRAHNVPWYEDDDAHGLPILSVLCCYVGEDNGWDYGEREKEILFDNEVGKYIEDNELVRVVPCDMCCGCGGW